MSGSAKSPKIATAAPSMLVTVQSSWWLPPMHQISWSLLQIPRVNMNQSNASHSGYTSPKYLFFSCDKWGLNMYASKSPDFSRVPSNIT